MSTLTGLGNHDEIEATLRLALDRTSEAVTASRVIRLQAKVPTGTRPASMCSKAKAYRSCRAACSGDATAPRYAG